ncbi:MAG: uncharacterized LabA/DUF88 family protein [Candidatus Endobugula sp.]|jgi:uncharacterized LabA/DUF88 family protein
MSAPTRVISYIDGFNLYFGLKSKGWKKYYWLDLVAMSASLLKDDQALQHCHYFTARIRNSGGNSQDTKRQSLWLDALDTLTDQTSHYGHYLQKTKTCKSCGAQWTTHEEKMTDVNIAAQLLTDAYENRFDTALVISGDSDLTTPIKMVLERFPSKRIIVAFPPGRSSHQLKTTATASFTIGEAKLRQNRLPNTITTTTGHTLHRPSQWY